jgi:hypothetical protein
MADIVYVDPTLTVTPFEDCADGEHQWLVREAGGSWWLVLVTRDGHMTCPCGTMARHGACRHGMAFAATIGAGRRDRALPRAA